MRSHLSLYLRLIGIQIRSQAQYRISFVFEILGSGLTTFLWFLSLALIFDRFDNLGGWTLPEVAFLYGMVELAFGTMDMIFSGFDPGYFGEGVRLGSFDQLMLRPMNLTLQVLGSRFVIRRLGRIAQGAIIFGLALSWLDIHWTATKLAYLPLVFLGLIFFFGGLFILGSTITFWSVQPIEVMNIFTYGGSEMISYPMHIYQKWMRQFFTYVLPAIFINYLPALYILDKPDPYPFPEFTHFLAPIAGLGVLVIALQFWRYGVRRYQSTGT
jgi:ABC-2 type transport system permease protein